MSKVKAGETVTSQRETQATPCPANEQGTHCQYKSQWLTHPLVRRAEWARCAMVSWPTTPRLSAIQTTSHNGVGAYKATAQ